MPKQLRIKVGNLVLCYSEEQAQEILQVLVEFLTDPVQRSHEVTICSQEEVEKLFNRKFRLGKWEVGVTIC